MQQAGRISQPAEKIGSVDKIEVSQVRAQIHGVALLKAHALRGAAIRQPGGERSRGRAFFPAGIAKTSRAPQPLRRGDETPRIVNGHDLATEPRHLESRPPHRAAEVQPALTRSAVRERRHRAHGEIQRLPRTGRPRHDIGGGSVVKKEILVEQAGGFVDAGHGASLRRRMEKRKAPAPAHFPRP